MPLRTALILIASVLLPVSARAADKVVVFPLTAKTGVKPAIADAVNDTFVTAIQSRGVQVITQRDVENMLELEQKKAELSVSVAKKLGEESCSVDTECLTQIGGALGARYLVTGSLSRVGGAQQLTAELMDQLKGLVVDRFNQISQQGGDDAFLELAQQAAAALFPDAEPARSSVKSEVSFGSGAQITVPTYDIVEVGVASLGELNIEAEELLEEALDAQDHKEPAEKVQAAWCSLAALTNNPYETMAKAACDGWTKFAEAVKAMESDHPKLVTYLELKRKTPEQRLAVVNAFLEAYGSIEAHERVAWARGVKERLEAGEEPAPWIEEFVEPASGLTFVRIPAGSFNQGCVSGDKKCDSDETPASRMELRTFSLGKTEVTARAYAKCAEAGVCSAKAESRDSDMGICNWKNGRLGHPMNCLTWDEARTFCGWIGGRLPTATEWEYAAKAGRDIIHPWGNEPVDGTRANYCDKNCPSALTRQEHVDFQLKGKITFGDSDGWAGTAPVGKYPRGANGWGLLDMAGNVWEMTESDYDQDRKEMRGGGWTGTPQTLRASYRNMRTPTYWYDFIGFRCAL